MITIIGGTYYEACDYPSSYALFGSGFRAAQALAQKDFQISFHSCIGKEDIVIADAICQTLNISSNFHLISETITFDYVHPLAMPTSYPQYHETDIIRLDDIESNNVIFYGQIEATVKVSASYLVYDPQNGVHFHETGSHADHLAIILNRKEAFLLSGLSAHATLEEIGKELLTKENAEVVIIKNGAKGALAIDHLGVSEIPVYETSIVWPIGSGDIFTAAFAWKWMINKLTPREAASKASMFAAQYCETRVLPLQAQTNEYMPLSKFESGRNIYLAGPFFNIAQRWLINELRNALIDFGNNVFSPFHEIDSNDDKKIVEADLAGIVNAHVILAVLSGLDAGTSFEIGYAKALKKRVVILAENIGTKDMTMFIGSNCEITDDFSTAVYKASW